MGINIKLCALYAASGLFFYLSFKNIKKIIHLSEKLVNIKNKKRFSPSELQKMFEEEGKNADIIIKNETEKMIQNAFVFGKTFRFDNQEKSDLIYYHKKITYLFTNNHSKVKEMQTSTFPFKLSDANSQQSSKETFVSVHQNDKVECLFPQEKIKKIHIPNKRSFMENLGLICSQTVLLIFNLLRIPSPLKNIFLGVNDEEFGIKLGRNMLIYGDLTYNCKDKTMRIEHPLKFLSSSSEIIKKLKDKIFVCKSYTAIFIIFGAVCLVFAIKTQKTADKHRKKNINPHILQMDYNEKRITTNGKDFRCMVCRTKQKNIILHPCSHLVMCKDCLEKNKEKAKSCPFCNQAFTETIEILIP